MTLTAKNLIYKRLGQSLFSAINFQVSEGDLLWISGVNGSGKSSLLHLLITLSQPDGGTIEWQSESIYTAENYLPNVHYLGHTNGIKLGLSVKENILLEAHLLQETISNQAIQQLLAKLNLQKHMNREAKYLSAGEKRKLGLIKLWLFPKKIWLLDEPLTALDRETQDFFMEHLECHLKKNGHAIISSHQPLPTAKEKLELLL